MKRRRRVPPKPPTPKQFVQRCRAFHRHELREAMYKVATFLVLHNWGKPAKMADGLGVLLMTWNQAFYRYGSFDYRKLEGAIRATLPKLEAFRARNISTFKPADEKDTKALFRRFATALQIAKGKSKNRRSPVAVAKALHLLAPRFYPLWDYRIAQRYRCSYNKDAAGTYIRFIRITQDYQRLLSAHIGKPKRPFTKAFDEYNYAKYTKNWT